MPDHDACQERIAELELELSVARRQLALLERQVDRMGETVDLNYAARLDADRASYAAVRAMDAGLRSPQFWDEPTATALDDQG